MQHTRHSDIFDARDLSVTLIGCGGIGAGTALALAKMGVGDLALIDGDVVSEENMATQLHKLAHLGMNKVDATAEMVKEFADDTFISSHAHRVEGWNQLVDQIVISAVDSIAARHDIARAVQNGKVRWYLDARMAAEEFQLFTVDMLDPGWYLEILAGQSDEGVPDLPCTAKATIFTAFIAAGSIASAVKAIAISEPFPRILVHNIRKNHMTVIR